MCVCVCGGGFSVRSAVGKNSWVTFVAVCYKVWEKNILFGGHVCPIVCKVVDLSAPKLISTQRLALKLVRAFQVSTIFNQVFS